MRKREKMYLIIIVWKEIMIMRVVGEEERKAGKIHAVIYIFFNAF